MLKCLGHRNLHVFGGNAGIRYIDDGSRWSSHGNSINDLAFIRANGVRGGVKDDPRYFPRIPRLSRHRNMNGAWNDIGQVQQIESTLVRYHRDILARSEPGGHDELSGGRRVVPKPIDASVLADKSPGPKVIFDQVTGDTGFVSLLGREKPLLPGGNLKEIGDVRLRGNHVIHNGSNTTLTHDLAEIRWSRCGSGRAHHISERVNVPAFPIRIASSG